MSIRGAIALFCALIFVSLPPPALAAHKEPPKPAAVKEAALAYISVTGASGDGEQALSSALAKRLTVAGVKQATALADNVYS
ncbi:MAG TPA: hypothetical protein VKD68_01620, partial [Methyloceanibacter sp.]|nr:hypothetical protein [Methyloceanibacter sp.]